VVGALSLSGRKHLWQGEWVGDNEVSRYLEQLPIIVQNALTEPLDTRVVLAACDRLSAGSKEHAFADVGSLLRRDTLENRICRELGTAHPFRLTRPDPRATVFEAWAPLGLLVHVPPTAALGALSAVEGLLTGNMNVVIATDPPLTVMARLAALDPTGQIASRIAILHGSKERDTWLRLACASADGVATWDGRDVSSYLPTGCRLIGRAQNISIAYVTRDAWPDESAVAALAQDMWRLDRSGPQTVYLDTDRVADIRTFAKWLEPSLAEAGEVRIEPLPRERLVETLWPMRRQLWTVGIAGGRRDVAELSRAALAAGARRVVSLGAMSDDHDNGPSDGCYTLQRYSQRVRVRVDERFASDACLNDLLAFGLTSSPRVVDLQPEPLPVESWAISGMTPPIPVLTKAEAQRRSQDIAPEHAQLYFCSGGSTGVPAVSVYTYDDYEANTRATAEGLLAAGLDPRRDRTANLFYSGQMYGGFVSFFGVLERLTATQIPVGAGTDLRSIAATLVEQRVDTLLGMPSYIWRLCRTEEETLRSYGGLRKIFYAGEHISAEQRRWLKEQLSVEMVKSAAYTTTDLGPLGYQCAHVSGAVHHLHTELHSLEILHLDYDRPAESGRLVFTRHTRRGQHLDRYDIGDLGRWVSGVCGCGRQSPRFELLGRRGDLIRIAAHFIDYRRLSRLAEELLGYAGDVQAVLDHDEDRERLTLLLDERSAPDVEWARSAFLASYPDLRTAVETQELLSFAIESVDVARLSRTPNSGKLQAVIDLRSRS
jgi:phenylacetate-coenzyme A ligase PaaK-like adenylate-forming protein